MLLDVLREDFDLTGTKDGCREGDCGTCLVLIGTLAPDGVHYRAVNSCLLPMGDVAGRHIVTIEGLNQPELNPVQRALIEEGAIQCGFCTPGLVIALTGFLLSGVCLSTDNGISALGGNICRCTGHVAIRRAVARLGERFQDLEAAIRPSSSARCAALVARQVLPPYFLDVEERLRDLNKGDTAAGADRDARPSVLVAGGTDLFVAQADELRDATLTFLARQDDLQEIRVENTVCAIGAAAPLTAIEESAVIRRIFPDLDRHLGRIAARPIRNRATVAGNIVNASPAGDLAVIFLALEATLVLAKAGLPRRVPLEDFFRGYKVLDMSPGEMISEIHIPVPDPATRFHFEKVGRRERLDIASASSAIKLRLDGDRIVEARVSAGSVAPVPLYLRKTSAFLRGRPISAAAAREAAGTAAGEISPISDIRGSADYKRALLPRLILAHFLVLFPEQIREEDFA